MDANEIKKIAHLARINIDDTQVQGFADDMTNTLKFVDQMNTVDTDEIKGLAHPLELKQRLREDQVTETDERAVFQKLAPATEAGLYLVPKVIEGEE